MDDGNLTDGQGNVINFKNTIIICTSNVRNKGNVAHVTLIVIVVEQNNTQRIIFLGNNLKNEHRRGRPDAHFFDTLYVKVS